jgi:hypothetical protein
MSIRLIGTVARIFDLDPHSLSAPIVSRCAQIINLSDDASKGPSYRLHA